MNAPTPLSTQEYVVSVVPEYGTSQVSAAGTKTMTVTATDYPAAALAAVRALLGSNTNTPPKPDHSVHMPARGGRERHYITRANRDGNRWEVSVDLSPDEKARIADAEALEAVRVADERASVAGELAEWEALSTAHPGIRVGVSPYSVEVTMECRWSNDYARVEVTKRDNGYGDTAGSWRDPASVRVGNGTLGVPATDLPVLVRALTVAGAIAADLDARYTPSSGALVCGPGSYPASVREGLATFRRVLGLVAAATETPGERESRMLREGDAAYGKGVRA